MRLFNKIFAIIILILFLFSCANRSQKTNTDIPFNKQGTVTIKNYLNQDIIFDVELAEDDWSRMQGLMFRYKLEDNQGMFFIMPTETYQSFWMRNTYLSLDMIFIDENMEIVEIYENAFPLSDDFIQSSYPAKYVLEVLAGMSLKNSIRVGDFVRFERFFIE